jgi:hypothetical protein
MSKLKIQIIAVLFLILAPFQASFASQTLEVILSFAVPVKTVHLDLISADGVAPSRYEIDSEGGLHLFFTFAEFTKDKVSLRIEEGAISFTDGTSSTLIEQTIPVERAIAASGLIAQTTLQNTAVKINQTLSAGKSFVDRIQPVTVTTLSGALVPILLFNPTIIGNIPLLPTYLYHFFSWLLSLFGLRKKRKPWGVVYNAITKEPIPLTIVRLLEGSGLKILETQVTDRLGRFGFISAPGNYRLEVVKPGFAYPSSIVVGTADFNFRDVYHAEPIILKGKEHGIFFNVPLDPHDPRIARANAPVAAARAVTKAVSRAGVMLLAIGTAINYVFVFFSPTLVNFNIFYLYLAFLGLQVTFQLPESRPWGEVFDSFTLKPIPLSIVSLVETKYDRVVKVRLTDYEGRFHFLPLPGSYKLVATAEGYRFPSTKTIKSKEIRNPYLGEELMLRSDQAIINVDVPLDPVLKA